MRENDGKWPGEVRLTTEELSNFVSGEASLKERNRQMNPLVAAADRIP